MPALTTNWIVLREAFENVIADDMEINIVSQVIYDREFIRRAASQMAVQVRRGSTQGLTETINQLVMSERMRGRAINEERLTATMQGLVFGALAGIAAVKSR